MGHCLRGQQRQRALDPAHLPHGPMPVSDQARERVARGERLEIAAIECGAFGEIGDMAEGARRPRAEQSTGALLR